MPEHINQSLPERTSPLAPNSTLGIISHKLHYIYNGEYYTTGGFTDYVEGLAAHFRQTILAVPVTAADDVSSLRKVSCKCYRIHPFWGRTTRTAIAWLSRSHIRRQACRAFTDCDIVNACMFSMHSLMALPAIEAMNKAIFFTLVGQIYARTAEKSRLRAMLVRRTKAALQKHLTFVRGLHLVDIFDLNPKMCLPSYGSTYHLTEIRENPILPPMRDEPIRLIFVGRVDNDKGIDVLLRALAAEPYLSQRFKLDIVGDGIAMLSLQKLAESLQLQSSVTFHGYLPHGEKWERLMTSAHAMAFVSLHEGAPKVVVEALRFGLAILASRVGAIPTVIKENVNGWLVDAGSSSQVVDALKLISKMDETGWKNISQANLKLARSYTIEEGAHNMVQALIERGLLSNYQV